MMGAVDHLIRLGVTIVVLSGAGAVFGFLLLGGLAGVLP